MSTAHEPIAKSRPGWHARTRERDGMLHSGMEQGLNESYAALDRVLAKFTGVCEECVS